MKRRLDLLFHGKCAYCETFYSASAPVDVEHYRPKGAVSEDPSHPGYYGPFTRIGGNEPISLP